MDIQRRIEAFAVLGQELRNTLSGRNDGRAAGLKEIINSQHLMNPWFTPENVTAALEAIAEELTPENLTRWTTRLSSAKIRDQPFQGRNYYGRQHSAGRFP